MKRNKSCRGDGKGLRDFVTYHKGFQDFKVGSKVFKTHDFPSTTPLSDLQQSDGWKDTMQCEYHNSQLVPAPFVHLLCDI